MDPTETDYQAYARLLDLWSRENPIKTAKLQTMLVVNAALVSIVDLGGGPGRQRLPLFLAGALVSLVWTLSIGRTVLFQKIWGRKLSALARSHPQDPRFQVLETAGAEREIGGWLRLAGAVSSRYYLVAAPALFCAAWCAGVFYLAVAG